MHTARLSQKQNTHLKTINGIATTTAKITTNGKSTTNWCNNHRDKLRRGTREMGRTVAHTTRDEWRELINNCDFTWTGMEGVTGALITSRINGNSIFLPAVGNMVGTEHTHDQLGCFYWTSTEYEQADITQECRNYRANIDASNRLPKATTTPTWILNPSGIRSCA